MELAALLDKVNDWAVGRADIRGVALVGSHARGAGRPDSDVDLVLLCVDPDLLVGGNWVSRFGEVRSVDLEDFGALQSLRVVYRDGLEVEFGIADPTWARVPLDPGTKSVLVDGVRILYDPENLFLVAKDAAVA